MSTPKPMTADSDRSHRVAEPAPDNRKRQHLVGVRLDDRELARLDELAARHGTTRPHLLRLALTAAWFTEAAQIAQEAT